MFHDNFRRTPISHLGNLDADLTLVLARPLVLVRLLELLELEHLAIDDRAELVKVGLNGSAHLLHLVPAADEQTASGAQALQVLEETRLVRVLGAADKAYDADDALNLDTLEALRHGSRARNLDDVVHAYPVGDLAHLGAPVGILLVVDNVVGAQPLQELGLLGGAGGGDDARAGCLGKLHAKDAHAAGALGQHPLARRKPLESVEGIPGRHGGAWQRGSLEEAQALGERDQTILIESADGAEDPVDGAAQTGARGSAVKVAAEVALIKQGDDLIALGKALDMLADGDDFTGTV